MSSPIIKNATIVVGVQQGKVSFKLPGMSELLTVQQKAIALAKQQEKQLQALKQVSADYHQSAVADAKQHAVAVDDVSRKLSSAGLSALRGFQQATTGAFQLARGIALLGVDGDKNLRKVLETIALIQGAFDVFRGTVNIIKGVVTVTRALAAAKAAEAAITSTSTAATVANTAAVEANIAPRLVLLAIANPYIAAFIAIGSAAGIAAVAISRLNDEEGRAERLQKRFTDELEIGTKAIEDRTTRTKQLRDLLDLSFSDRSQEKFNSIGSDQSLLERELQRAQALAAVDREQSLKRQVAIHNQLAGLAREGIQIEKRRTEQAIKLNEQRAEEVKQLNESIRAQQRAVEAEQNKVRATQAALGQLGPQGEAQLRSIAAKKARGGTLSTEELQLIAGLGDAGAKFAEAEFAQRGKATQGLLERLIGKKITDERDAAQQTLEVKQNILSEKTGGKTADEFLDQIKTKNETLQKNFDDFLTNTSDNVDRLLRLVERQSRELTRMEQQAERSNL